jgi:hypothetical protein
LIDYLGGPSSGNAKPKPKYDNPPVGTTVFETVPQTIRVASATAGAGVLVQTDTQTYYIDQGNHTNVVVPSQPPN